MEYFAHSVEIDGMMHEVEQGMGYGMANLGWVWMVLIVMIMVVAIYWLVRVLGNTSSAGKADDPLDILKNRYAKGEITKKEFDQAKKDIAGK